MATAGPTICGTGSNYNDGGYHAWANPTNIQADDNTSSISSGLSAGDNVSQMLYAKNFGFALPAGATVTNVSFSYERKRSGGAAKESNVAMLDASGSPGTNKADTATTWSTSSEVITKSGNGTYWGITLTPALVNDPDFGLQIKAKNNEMNDAAVYVDYVSCTVTYTLPAGGVCLIGIGLCGASPLISQKLISRTVS